MNRGSHPWAFYTLQSRVYRLAGSDGRDLLQRISTADLSTLRAGAPVATLLMNEKGRVVDLALVQYESAESLLVNGVGDHDGRLQRWLERYIIMEDARVLEAPERHTMAVAYTPHLQDAWQMPATLAARAFPVTMGRNTWALADSVQGRHGDIKDALIELGGYPVDAAQFDTDRILAGLPWVGPEIGEHRNPLEARLRGLINFTKGCYIGQEVIARLDSYRKVAMVLTRFQGTIASGESTPVALRTSSGQEAGIITSIASHDSPVCALGFVRVGELNATEPFQTERGTLVEPLDRDPIKGVYE